MREITLSRDRMMWIAVAIVFATSASWLAAIGATVIARQAGFTVPPDLLVAGRALFRVALVLLRQAAPAAMIALFFAGMVAVLAYSAVRRGAPANQGARHV